MDASVLLNGNMTVVDEAAVWLGAAAAAAADAAAFVGVGAAMVLLVDDRLRLDGWCSPTTRVDVESDEVAGSCSVGGCRSMLFVDVK